MAAQPAPGERRHPVLDPLDRALGVQRLRISQVGDHHQEPVRGLGHGGARAPRLEIGQGPLLIAEGGGPFPEFIRRAGSRGERREGQGAFEGVCVEDEDGGEVIEAEQDGGVAGVIGDLEWLPAEGGADPLQDVRRASIRAASCCMATADSTARRASSSWEMGVP